MIPPASTARGMISTASPSERASDSRPTRDGEGTSPKRWIVKMLKATAVARMCGETTLTIAELIGPVEANRHSSGGTMAAEYTAGCGAASATRATGAGMSVTTHDHQRDARRDTRRY